MPTTQLATSLELKASFREPKKEKKNLVDPNVRKLLGLEVQASNSSLHWPILLLFYALFVQWSITAKGPKVCSSS